MATTNFTFTTLTGTETAGWNSINALINNIDSQLNTSNRLVYMAGGTPTSGYTITWDSVNSRWSAGQVGSAAIANNAVELGTKTTGNYVATIAGQADEVSVSGSGSESASVSVRLADNTALRGAATVASPPTYTGGSTGIVGRVPDAKYVTDALAYATAGNITLTGDVTLSSGVATIQPTVVTEGKIASNAISQAKMADNSVGTAEIIDANVTYAKLASNAKTYSVASTATAGVYFTASGDFTAASLSSASAQNPFVIANHASTAIILSLPTGIGSVGDTITVCQYGAATTTISPKSGAAATINGSTTITYLVGGQYSIITLVCVATNTWVITGDYI